MEFSDKSVKTTPSLCRHIKKTPCLVTDKELHWLYWLVFASIFSINSPLDQYQVTLPISVQKPTGLPVDSLNSPVTIIV